MDCDFKPNQNKAIYLDGARVFIRDIQCQPPLIFQISHDFPFIKLHLICEGSCTYEPKTEDGVPIAINSGQYNFFYLPKVQGSLCIQSSNMKSIDIECDEDFLRKMFIKDFYKTSGPFGEAIRKELPFKMWEESRVPSKNLKQILKHILECVEQTEVDHSYLKLKLKLLFQQLFSEMRNEAISDSLQELHLSELEQVARAERILRDHIQKSITVEELALHVGTNRFKLNRYFKQIYKEPVFTYLTRIRMETAKRMLVNENRNISEVAYEVGYKNPQHFTVAFKKHFGHVPSQLKAGGYH